MGAYEVHLQFTNLVAGNADLAQFPDAGSDCVSDLVAGNDLVDDGPRPVH